MQELSGQRALVITPERLERSLLQTALRQEGAIVRSLDATDKVHGIRHGFDLEFSDIHGAELPQERQGVYRVGLASRSSSKKPLAALHAKKYHDLLWRPLDTASVMTCLFRYQSWLAGQKQHASMASWIQSQLVIEAGPLFEGSWSKTFHDWVKNNDLKQHPLLIQGNLGTGKLLLTRYFHHSSQHRDTPLTMVLCANTSQEALETEIFGKTSPKKKNSTDAALMQPKNGLVVFHQAQSLSKRLQHKLFQVETTKHFSPLGGGQRHRFRGRFVFVLQGDDSPRQHLTRDWSKKLLNRRLVIPNLQDRIKDLPAICRLYLKNISQRYGLKDKALSKCAVQALSHHPFHRNFKELEVVLLGSVFRSKTDVITRETLRPFLDVHSYMDEEGMGIEMMLESHLDHFFGRYELEHLRDLHEIVAKHTQRPLIRQVLSRSKSNQLKASRILGINRNTLRRKIHDLDIQI